jgi:hypothetical protein
MSAARPILFVLFAFQCAPAAAAVTCEQLADIAYTTEQLRNRGELLSAVVAEADKLEATGKFTREELDTIKGVVDRAFKGIQSPLEVLQACRQKLKK